MSVKSICMAGSFESKGEMFVGGGGLGIRKDCWVDVGVFLVLSSI